VKNVKLNYLIVGLFTIVVVTGLFVTVSLLTGRTGATDNYYASYDNVSGIRFGTRVLYEGYPVGQVEEILPRQVDGKTRFLVEMSVIRGWKIPKDSTAEIAASGLLAAVTMTIREGKSTEILTPGSELASRETNNIMLSVGDLARDIKDLTETEIRPLMTHLNVIVRGVSELIGGDQGAQMGGDVRQLIRLMSEAAPDIVRNVNNFSTKLDALMSERNMKALDSMIDNMGASARNMADVTRQLGETRKSLDALLGEIRGIVVDNKDGINQSVDDLRHTTETIARYIDSINQNLDITARNMSEFSRALRQNPGLLLGGGAPATDSTTGRR
jgi:phospholipid/cholesterol/gamma-HCH transport system substrate-binding protein